MTATAPSMPAPGEDRAVLEVKHRLTLMWAVMGVSICQFLDATIANVALPHMQTALGASMDSVSWVLTSFIMAGAITMPITGWVSDRFGSRSVFLTATAVFLLASGLCGAATSLAEMVAFRALQGMAAAFIGPMSQTIIFDINRPSKQASAMSLWGMTVMVAPISGPLIGAYLTDTLNWRWIYYVNLPLGIPALVGLWFLLPSRPAARRRLDHFGFWTIALGLGALQLVLDRGQGVGWLTSREVVIELIVAASCIWLFLLHTLRTKTPLFNFDLFKNRNFVAGLGFMSVLGVANVALAAALPTMYQNVYHYPVIETGLLAAPRGFGVMITMQLTNYLIKRVDYRYLISMGYALAATAMWSMTRWSLDMDWHPIVMASFIQGLGLGFVFTPMNMVAFATLKPELRTDGSSLLSLFRNLGGSIGISVIVTMLARNIQVSHADIAANVHGDVVPGMDLSVMADRFPGVGTAALQMLDGLVNEQAMMIAYLDNFTMLTWVLAAIVPLPFLLSRPPRGDVFAPPHGE